MLRKQNPAVEKDGITTLPLAKRVLASGAARLGGCLAARQGRKSRLCSMKKAEPAAFWRLEALCYHSDMLIPT